MTHPFGERSRLSLGSIPHTDLVAGSGLEFEERGEHELKGVPGRWAVCAVRSRPSPKRD